LRLSFLYLLTFLFSVYQPGFRTTARKFIKHPREVYIKGSWKRETTGVGKEPNVR
jgi:hypothetical protein